MDAERYVDQIIPQQRHEGQLWEDLAHDSRSVSPDHLENELKTLDKILILGGARQQEAREMHETVIAQLARMSAEKSRKPLLEAPTWGRERMPALQNQFDQAVQKGDAQGLQELEKLRGQFKTMAGNDSAMAMSARDYLNNLVPKAQKQIQATLAAADSAAAANKEYDTAVRHYNQAVAAGDPERLRSGALTEFRQIVSFGGVRASEAAHYVNVLIPQAVKAAQNARKDAGLSASQADSATE